MKLFALLGVMLLLPTPITPPAVPGEGSLDSPPVLIWERRLPGPPVSSATHTELSRPAIAGDLALMGSATNSALLAVHRGSGEVLWSYSAMAPVAAEPVVYGDRVWFSDSAGYTACFAIEGGEPLWTHYGGAPILSRPSLAGGTLFVATVDDTLYALDADTGAMTWRYQRPPDNTRVSELTLFGAPSPTIAGDTLLAGFSDGALLGFDRATGQVRWERRVGEGRYPDLIGTPLVVDQVVYVGGYSEPFVALDLQTRDVRWRLDIGTFAGVAADGDRLYHGGTDGKMRAIQRVTGEVLWTWDSGSSGALTAPQVTPAGILISSSDAGIWLVNPEDGSTTWTYEPGYHLDGVTVAPVLAGRQLLVLTNAGNLLSFVAPRPARSVLWPKPGGRL